MFSVSATSCGEIQLDSIQEFLAQFVARLCNKVWHRCNLSCATKVSCVISLTVIQLTVEVGWSFHSETEMDACVSKVGPHVRCSYLVRPHYWAEYKLLEPNRTWTEYSLNPWFWLQICTNIYLTAAITDKCTIFYNYLW